VGDRTYLETPEAAAHAGAMSDDSGSATEDVGYAESQSNGAGGGEGYCSDDDIRAILQAAGVSDGNVA
jgi:hypothetical protein